MFIEVIPGAGKGLGFVSEPQSDGNLQSTEPLGLLYGFVGVSQL